MPATEAPVRLAYVMGSGRSGSTVFDIVMGHHAEVESTGELCNLARNGWINNEYCACGEQANNCPFWNRVRDAWSARVGHQDVAGYVALQAEYETYTSIGAWMRLIRELKSPSESFRRYQCETVAMLQAVREVSGKPLIVDSSKLPARGYALSASPDVDLRVIHLVRDARGVICSTLRPYSKDEKRGLQRDIKPRPIWRTAAFWLIANKQSDWVRGKLPAERSLRVRYEDFAAQPQTTMNAIGKLLDIDYSGVAESASKGDSIQIRHTVAGNYIRMNKSVRLEFKEAWRTELSAAQKRQCWQLTGWLASHYGYTP